MIKKILITGFGFIGRHVSKLLVERNYEVSILERKPDIRSMAKLKLNPIIGDIRDSELMGELIPYYDGVINLAALLGTAELMDNHLEAINTNIVGAINVFEGCKRANELGKKVPCVQITVGNHFMDNPYSITKSVSERFANMYNTEHHTDVRIVRVFNAYGEYQKHFPVRKIIPNFIRASLLNRSIIIYGSGDQIMDMIYVGDVANILIESLVVPQVNGVISAGTGRRLCVNDIAKIVIEHSSSTSKLKHVSMRPGEIENSIVLGEPDTLVDIGIQPDSLTKFEEGIVRTIDWYKKNMDFIDI